MIYAMTILFVAGRTMGVHDLCNGVVHEKSLTRRRLGDHYHDSICYHHGRQPFGIATQALDDAESMMYDTMV